MLQTTKKSSSKSSKIRCLPIVDGGLRQRRWTGSFGPDRSRRELIAARAIRNRSRTCSAIFTLFPRLNSAPVSHLVNPSPQKYSTLPKFGNDVCVAASRLILEGRSRVVMIASRACGGRGQRRVREARAGRVVPVSPKPRIDERRCQVRLAGNSQAMSTRPGNIAAVKRAVRTAKPCGPGRRRYGQACRGGAGSPTG